VAAHALYLKLGFTEIGREAGFDERDGALVDNIVMSKRL
jgi:RimJ/RimL family protein N-acetyltransferase